MTVRAATTATSNTENTIKYNTHDKENHQKYDHSNVSEFRQNEYSIVLGGSEEHPVGANCPLKRWELVVSAVLSLFVEPSTTEFKRS